MQGSNHKGRQSDLVILLFLFAAFLLNPPLTTWWSSPGNPWYLPYLFWFGIILLTAWLSTRRERDDL